MISKVLVVCLAVAFMAGCGRAPVLPAMGLRVLTPVIEIVGTDDGASACQTAIIRVKNDGTVPVSITGINFGCSCVELLSASDQPIAVGDIVEIQNRVGLRGCAANQGADASDQLTEVERLDQIIVRTAVEPLDAILQRIARGEHEYRRLHVLGTDRFQNLQSVAPRKRQIEQNEIERLGGDAEVGALAGAFDDDLVVFALEPLSKRVGDLLFVFDHQQLRRAACCHVTSTTLRQTCLRR